MDVFSCQWNWTVKYSRCHLLFSFSYLVWLLLRSGAIRMLTLPQSWGFNSREKESLSGFTWPLFPIRITVSTGDKSSSRRSWKNSVLKVEYEHYITRWKTKSMLVKTRGGRWAERTLMCMDCLPCCRHHIKNFIDRFLCHRSLTKNKTPFFRRV